METGGEKKALIPVENNSYMSNNKLICNVEKINNQIHGARFLRPQTNHLFSEGIIKSGRNINPTRKYYLKISSAI
jgi:hypothetical protein